MGRAKSVVFLFRGESPECLGRGVERRVLQRLFLGGKEGGRWRR